MNIFSINESLSVAVATQNQGKLEGVAKALFIASSHESASYVLKPVKTESGVADTPLSDEEGILGCENRLLEIEQRHSGLELYIALEGVMAQVNKAWFVRGWTKVKHAPSGRNAIACGAAVQIPPKLVPALDDAKEFSRSVSQLYDVTADEGVAVRDVGVNGVFSQGEYVRSNTFFDGVRICLAYIENDRNW